MAVDQYPQLEPWEAAAGTKDERWLAPMIRGLLWSWVGNAEPSPTTWARIKERLLRLQRRGQSGLAAPVISETTSHSVAETRNLDAASRSKDIDVDKSQRSFIAV